MRELTGGYRQTEGTDRKGERQMQRVAETKLYKIIEKKKKKKNGNVRNTSPILFFLSASNPTHTCLSTLQGWMEQKRKT